MPGHANAAGRVGLGLLLRAVPTHGKLLALAVREDAAIHRVGETRVVELDVDVFQALFGGLLVSSADFVGAVEEVEVRDLVALLLAVRLQRDLDVEGEGLDVASEANASAFEG